MWILFGYGLIFITITQGMGFLALNNLATITVSFVLNFSTVLIIIFSYFVLNEKPNSIQNILILISLAGEGIYFIPLDTTISCQGRIHLLQRMRFPVKTDRTDDRIVIGGGYGQFGPIG